MALQYQGTGQNNQPIYKDDGIDLNVLNRVKEGGKTFLKDQAGQYSLGGLPIEEFDQMFNRALPRGNPDIQTNVPFMFDPGAFNLGNFQMGGDIRGRMGDIRGGAAATAINNMLTGNAPSLAQLQLAGATESNLSNISSLVNAQRGNPLAFRQGLRAGEEAQRGLGRDAALLRAQETLGAIQSSQAQDQMLSQLVELGLKERLAKQSGAIDLQKTQAEELRQRDLARIQEQAGKKTWEDFALAGVAGLSDVGAALATGSK